MPDHRDRRAKLRAMANQTISPHEAAIARAKLAAMGERVSPPKVVNASRASTDEIFETMNRANRAFFESLFVYRVVPTDDWPPPWSIDEMRREAEAKRGEAQAEETLQVYFPCPGCGHYERDHVAFRCYECHPNAKIEAAERRAVACGWQGVKMEKTILWAQRTGWP